MNLISNSLKFTNSGKISISINQLKHSHIREIKHNALCGYTFIEFIVKDTGVGIPEDDIKKLFKFDFCHDGKSIRKVIYY